MNFIPIGILLGFLIFNYLTPLVSDDFSYSFSRKTGVRITSIDDIIVSQYHHYFVQGGRSVAHFIAQYFLLFNNKYFFNIANTIVYGLFILLIQFHISGSFKKNIKLFVAINLFFWFFVPVWGQNFLWLTGSCNYLWTTTIILLFLIPFRKKMADKDYRLNILLTFLFIFVGVLAGWSIENSGAAVLSLLIAYFIRKKIIKEKICLFEILLTIWFLVGFIVLIKAPGNYFRLKNASAGQGFILFELVKRFVLITMNLFRYCSLPVAMSIIIGFDLIVHQKKQIDIQVWFYFLTGFAGLYSMLLSPQFPERAMFISLVFFCIGFFSILRHIKIEIPAIITRTKKFVLIFCIGLFVFGSLLPALRDIYKAHKIWEDRIEYFDYVKKRGNDDITLFAPWPIENRHVASYKLDDLVSDPNGWPNRLVAKYFGIKSITGVIKQWF